MWRVCSRPKLAAGAQAIAVFHKVMNQKCERSVITFSSLASACVKGVLVFLIPNPPDP